ncbi:FliM/FliN family flagellar motor switch protein [Aestuariicoccus sp. KMU-90]|uniref:FliM/FliN family flagellar motor switch protein n=2 Tax=Thetidibacter halocola TaxID=2827239 RepID=A0A8J7WFL3_9RHOB|nr:FliM/FliN family flagellar motor switch protein [Thetidibacter halocola]
MSPAKALRRALSRAADVLWDLALVGQSVQIDMRDQDGVVGGLGQDTLIVLLDGPEGAIGLAEIDRQVLTGLVEVQTIQQVTTMPVEDRPLSPTDAAMVAPLIDNALERFAAYLDQNPLRLQVEGYRFGAMMEDARGVGLLLDAPAYRAFRVELDLALGRRRGVVTLILPDRPQRQAQAEAQQGRPGPHEDAMLRVPVRLDCALARLVIPLSQAERLRPGDLLPLPSPAAAEAELRSARGEVVARGRLGQMHGMRALRITWPAAQAGATPGAARAAQAALPQPAATRSFDAGSDAGFDGGDDFGIDQADMDDIDAAAEPAIDFAADAVAFDMGEFDSELGGEDAFAAEAGGGAGNDIGGEEAFAADMDFDFSKL